jgi:hypothetical protein
MSKPEIRFVAYRQHGEPARRAGLAPVDFSLDALSDQEINLLGHLSAAANAMNAVFRDQFCSLTEDLVAVLRAVIPFAEGDLKAKLDDYLVIVNLQNGPWSLLPRKNHLLSVEATQMEALADKAGVKDAFKRIRHFLFTDTPLPDKANFYPADIDADHLVALGADARLVNASVVWDETGNLVSLLNEARYKKACGIAKAHLYKARELSENVSFQIYLDAKIEELTTGTEEARRLADYHWVRHDSPIDIVLSTAIEVYLDNWKNAKGAAAGNVTLVNRDADELLKKLIAMVPQLEASAPWTWRRDAIDPSSLPKLKFVDVLTWTGDYVTSPMTTIAQSLPNDEWVGKNVGTVNMVYRNTGLAVHSVSGDLLAEKFLPAAVVADLGDALFDAGQLHSALHEIGHTTGHQDPQHPGQPRDYLEAEYSPLEEARAELFGMWAAEQIRDAGVIDVRTARATHYSMLLSMISSLKFDPNQAHIQARNMMWHFFDSRGVIARIEENGELKFGFVEDKLFDAICEMLKTVADLKAAGDKAGAAKLREKHCYLDELKTQIEERTKDMPLGRGLTFPEIRSEGGRYLRDLAWPDFNEQTKFRNA